MRSSRRRFRGAFLRLFLLTLTFTLLSTGLAIPGPARAKVEMRALRLLPAEQAAAVGWTRTVVPEISTELVAVRWEGRRAGAVDVRVQQNGKWLPWTRLHGNPDEGPDPSSPERRNFTTAGPAWTGQNVDSVQLRVAEGRLPGLSLHLIHSPPAPKTWSAPSASASPAFPGFISRGQWGANEAIRNTPNGCTTNPEYAPTVKNGIVHHTVNINTYGPDEADDLIRGIYEFHVKSNGWCDIGYNFIVDRFGRLFEGRYGGVDRAVIGAHAGGFNTGSTGVALLGDFRSTAPSPDAMRGLRTLLAWKFELHGVDPGDSLSVTSSGSTKYPSGATAVLSTISGHRDTSDTDCPGDRAYALLGQLRWDVQSSILATPPHPLPGWRPPANQPRLLALNGYGGLQPAGSQPAVTHGGYWPGWLIARGVTKDIGGGGYVLDGWGGLHRFGGAPVVSQFDYWPRWDITRGVVSGKVPGTGYVLDGWGGLHPFGGAPWLPYSGYWPNFDIARGIALAPDGLSGYVLDGYGGVHPFGAASRPSQNAYWGGWDIARGIAVRPDGRSGYILDGWGGVHPFGGAPKVSMTRYTPNNDSMRGIALNTDGTGGWVVDLDGRIWPFGSAAKVTQSATWTSSRAGRGLVFMG